MRVGAGGWLVGLVGHVAQFDASVSVAEKGKEIRAAGDEPFEIVKANDTVSVLDGTREKERAMQTRADALDSPYPTV